MDIKPKTVKVTYDYIDFTNLETFPNYLISQCEISSIIKKSKLFKVPRSKEIQTLVLKHLPVQILVQLTYSCSTSLKLQYYIYVWKQAIAIPLKKTSKTSNRVGSYRSISLNDSVDKILEKLTPKHLNRAMTDNNTIIKEQFKFRKRTDY